MKRLLLILTFVSAAQASITEEDATHILDHIGANGYKPEGVTTEKLARSLVRFTQACTFNTSDMTQKFNWQQRSDHPGSMLVGFNLRSKNCAQLSDVMKEMAQNTEKYEAAMIERLKKSAEEIDAAQ